MSSLVYDKDAFGFDHSPPGSGAELENFNFYIENYMYFFLALCIHTHTHTHIYIYTQHNLFCLLSMSFSGREKLLSPLSQEHTSYSIEYYYYLINTWITSMNEYHTDNKICDSGTEISIVFTPLK